MQTRTVATIERKGYEVTVKYHYPPESLTDHERQAVEAAVDKARKEIEADPFYQHLRATILKVMNEMGVTLDDMAAAVKKREEQEKHKKCRSKKGE